MAILKYFKHSNTGEIVVRQSFNRKGWPDFFYDHNLMSIPEPNMKGFVEITEKTFNREQRRRKQRSINP